MFLGEIKSSRKGNGLYLFKGSELCFIFRKVVNKKEIIGKISEFKNICLFLRKD